MANIPLDTRFIGIAPEVNLYERKTSSLNAQTQPYTMADFIAASGGAVPVTKEEIDILINDNGLVPGATYEISGVDAPLYGGTTIFLQAATTNELALSGHGIFYNPKYINYQDQIGNGYGIWRTYITLAMSNIVGTFNNGDTVTANNGATATYLAQGFLSWISGDWSAATSIDNGAGATADVTGGVSPSYSIGQDVIWGGKHWTNTSGNVGTATNKYTLSSADWTAVAFNATDYNVVADVIHYDYEHDLIIRRKDKWNNDVDVNYDVFIKFSNPDDYNYGNPIKDFQWGNGPEDTSYESSTKYGVIGNYVKNSYLECINFIGQYMYNNSLNNMSYYVDNILFTSSYIIGNLLEDATIYRNILGGFSNGFANNKITNGSINDNILINYSSINDNIFFNSGINSNSINNGDISSNSLTTSTIQENIITISAIVGNELINESGIRYNSLLDSVGIMYNSLSIGTINNNEITNGSAIRNNTLSISDNTFTNNSQINSNTVANSSYIDNNTLIIGSVSFNILNGSYLRYNTVNYSKIENNTSSNSLIYNNVLSQISEISYNDIFNYTFIDGNTLDNESTINTNQSNGSYMSENNLSNGYINNNILSGNSYILRNTINYNSYIEFNQLSGSRISFSTLIDSVFDFSSSGTISSLQIRYINANKASAIFDISTATIIYGNYSKEMFRNSAGTTRLGYYNASDVFTVVNVNA